jgi:hypothetical protein
MRQFWSASALALLSVCVAACATPPAPTPQSPAETLPPYSQVVANLTAATRTADPYQNTAMLEREPCLFAYEISPGRQSTLQFAFDVRLLNLNAVSAAEGQASQSAYSRRIACAANKAGCATFNGAPVGYIEIAGQSPEDLDRAVGAMRQAQEICAQTPR